MTDYISNGLKLLKDRAVAVGCSGSSVIVVCDSHDDAVSVWSFLEFLGSTGKEQSSTVIIGILADILNMTSNRRRRLEKLANLYDAASTGQEMQEIREVLFEIIGNSVQEMKRA